MCQGHRHHTDREATHQTSNGLPVCGECAGLMGMLADFVGVEFEVREIPKS